MNIVEQERAKYKELWESVPDYSNYSPGAENVERFMATLDPLSCESLIDVGCGTGIAGSEFEARGLDVTYLDITDAALLPSISRKRFIEATLWSDWHLRHKHGFDYGYCCDVMEHIPTEYTMLVLDRIISVCRTTWFQIALEPDQFGAAIGQPLHLTVRPFAWWLERIRSMGDVIDARDLCGQALIVVSR